MPNVSEAAITSSYQPGLHYQHRSIGSSVAPSLPSPLLRPGGGYAMLVRQVGEKIIALVVDHDEGGEVDDVDLPHRLHAELGIFDDLDMLDAVLRQPGRRAADRAQIEAAMFLAGLGDLARAVALGQGHEAAAGCHEFVDVAVHAAGRGRAQ